MITFTTDFGVSDWFVGTMKGVIAGIDPASLVVDLNHHVPPGDLRAGAFSLMAGYAYFPSGTIHVAVVDPGVGSTRRAIVVSTERFTFVGPDNGVLSWVLNRERIQQCVELGNPEYRLAELSHTFHGRDLFAPVAAHLARGVPIQDLGPPVAPESLQALAWPEPSLIGGCWHGEVVYVDRFGNAITNLGRDALEMANEVVLTTTGRGGLGVAERVRIPVGTTYADVRAGEPVAVLGSTGFLEVAIRDGSAKEQLGLGRGDPVVLRDVH